MRLFAILAASATLATAVTLLRKDVAPDVLDAAAGLWGRGGKHTDKYKAAAGCYGNAGHSCTDNDECCSPMVCLQSKECGDCYGSEGHTCTRNSDCCTDPNNLVCGKDNTCVPCLGLNAGCNNPGQCCSGSCGTGGKCSGCNGAGGSCDADADCCTGSCSNSKCSDCSAKGYSCSSNSDCCNEDPYRGPMKNIPQVNLTVCKMDSTCGQCAHLTQQCTSPSQCRRYRHHRRALTLARSAPTPPSAAGPSTT